MADHSTAAVTAQARRQFFKTAGSLAVAAWAYPTLSRAAGGSVEAKAEGVVAELYKSLSADQRKKVCFAWDFQDPKRGLLRSRIAANWRITEPPIHSDFFTPAQKRMVRAIFEALVQPDWVARFDQQLKDDDEGFGTHQTMAIFGEPGKGPFQFALTGRHMTVRCDGGSSPQLAFGGPIFYGHAASGFHEKPNHPNNIFWPQAVMANEVFKMLDGKQQAAALVKSPPPETAVSFQGPEGQFPGIPVKALSADQQAHLHKVLAKLIEPYRQSDRDKVLACLKSQGGLEKCSLAFYEDGDLGGDKVWDIWRLEGPAFVWHFRGSPHVHTWVHIANDPTVKLNI